MALAFCICAVLAVWTTVWRIDGIAKVLTALSSVVVVRALWPLIPSIAAMRAAGEELMARKVVGESVSHELRTEEGGRNAFDVRGTASRT